MVTLRVQLQHKLHKLPVFFLAGVGEVLYNSGYGFRDSKSCQKSIRHCDLNRHSVTK